MLLGAFGLFLIAGRWSAARVHRLATASWLAVLPWPEDARQRAVAGAVRAYAITGAGAAAFVVWIACRALHLDHSAFPAALSALSAAAGFYSGARIAPGTRDGQAEAFGKAENGARGQAARGAWRLVDALDRAAPRHDSLWAWSGRLTLILPAACLSVVPVGGAAAAVTLTQHQAMPVLALAVLGGNAVFVATLRCTPLDSAVFRTSSLGFAAAVAAMMRAPIALSTAWFAAVLAVPLAGDGRILRMIPAALAALLLLDGLYAGAAVFRPGSPRQAMLLYGAGIYAIAYETATSGVPYGALTLVAVAVMAVLVTRRARIAYRSGHG
jgi:hypothetical protein